MSVTPSPIGGFAGQFFDNNGVILSGGKIYTYAAGTTTPQATYTSVSGSTPHANPIILDSAGRVPSGEIWLTDGLVYKFKIDTAANILIGTYDNISGTASEANLTAFENSLAAPSGAGLVGYNLGAPQSDNTTVLARLRGEGANAVIDYGCDNTGATNTTTKLKEFFDDCIAAGRPGHIPAGVYKVTPGALVFNSNFTDKVWPEISTDGHYATIFRVDSASTADAPIITITNGTATSPVGKYWRGGSLGGIFFDELRTGYSNTHGLSLTGITNCQFGYMYSEDLQGDLIRLPVANFGGNPDPNAISGCFFEGVEGIRCKGWSYNNLNGVGNDGVKIGYLRGIENEGGGVFGCGQGFTINSMSLGSCKGWAWDDGSNSISTASNRTVIQDAEIDNCENGIRLNRITNSDFIRIRFVHRYQFAPNAAANYWPRVCMSFGEGTAPNCQMINVDNIHRIEAGGLKANLGEFYQFGSGVVDVNINFLLLDNAAFGFTNTDFYNNLTFSNTVLIQKAGQTIWNSIAAANAAASFSGTMSIINSGAGNYAAATGILPFNAEQWDLGSNFDATTYGFTAPYDGFYRVTISLIFPSAVGTRVRLAALYLRSGVYSVAAVRSFYSGNASALSYELDQIVSLNAGDVLYASADQNTAGAINMAPITSNSAEVLFSVAAV